MELQQQEIEPSEIEPVARPSLRGQQMDLLPSFDDIHLEPGEGRIDHDDEVRNSTRVGNRKPHPCRMKVAGAEFIIPDPP